MPDVLLVQMPYGSIERPAIGLSILHASLKPTEVSSQVLYATFEFAQEIGLDLYYAISVSPNEELIGEWTFAGAAFPDHHPDHDRYLDAIEGIFEQSAFRIFRLYRAVDMKRLMFQLREQAVAFIDHLAQRIVDLKPHIVGCGSSFQQHVASLALLKRIKTLAPDVITLMGGANCESDMGLATQRLFPWVDVVVSGEADELFYPLCQGLLNHGLDWQPDEIPPGVLGLAKDDLGTGLRLVGEPGRAARSIVEDLNNSPVPDYDDYYQAIRAAPCAKYVQPGLLVETSRGCWWGQTHHCTFCGLNGQGMDYRAKNPQRVVEEFKTQTQRYGIRRLALVDNILNLHYLDTVIPTLAAEEQKFDVFCEVKANLKLHQLEHMVAAGIRWIQPGIESLNDDVLRLLDKGITGLMNVQFLKWCRMLGMRLAWIFLYDIPYEQDAWYQDMADLVPLISHYQPPDGLTRVQYHRFSPYFQRPAEFDIKLSPSFAYAYVYPLALEDLKALAYFFDDYENPQRLRLLQRDLAQTRPGLNRLLIETDAWRQQWFAPLKSQPLPRLSMYEDETGLHIVDTRPCAVQPEIRLQGLHRDVYTMCESIRAQTGLLRALQEHRGAPVAWEEVGPVIEDLKALKLLVQQKNRFLSLAIREPVQPLAGILPWGYINVLQYRRDRRMYA